MYMLSVCIVHNYQRIQTNFIYRTKYLRSEL